MRHTLIHKDDIHPKGIHTFKFFEYHKEQDLILKEIAELTEKREVFRRLGLLKDGMTQFLNDQFNLLKKQLSKYQTRELIIHNKIVNNGLNVLAARTSGDNTYSAQINYTALGTDPTAVTANDSQLGAETYRKAISSGTFLNNIAYIQTFLNPTEVTGTFEEYGNFIDGSGSANSGVLFNRFTQPITKSSSESLIVLSQITYNDA